MQFPQWQDGSFKSNFKLGVGAYLSLLTTRCNSSVFSWHVLDIDDQDSIVHSRLDRVTVSLTCWRV